MQQPPCGHNELKKQKEKSNHIQKHRTKSQKAFKTNGFFIGTHQFLVSVKSFISQKLISSFKEDFFQIRY